MFAAGWIGCGNSGIGGFLEKRIADGWWACLGEFWSLREGGCSGDSLRFTEEVYLFRQGAPPHGSHAAFLTHPFQHPHMDIQIATLCDFAADYNGKLVISGTFDTLAARAVPVVHPSCALAMRFCFTPEDAGRHKLSINIINEDGESLDPNNMPIEPEFDVQLPKNVPFLTRNIIMNLQGLRFEEAGIYSIDIGCDGEILVRLPLRIVLVNQGPNGETQMA